MLKRVCGLSGCVLVGLLCSVAAFAKPDIKLTKHNELFKPQDYRQWLHVGTSLTPHDKNNGQASFPEFHNVYMNRQSWKPWQKSGKFPEGTVIVKELAGVGAHEAISGKGYFQGNFTGIAVMVKDKKRFPNKPGNWGFYAFGNDDSNAVKGVAFDDKNCAPCHSKHAQVDMVFTQYYPILSQAILKQPLAGLNKP